MPRPTLFTHPKFRRLAHVLGISRPQTVGHLVYMWRVAWEDGDPELGDELDVELAAEWDGERGKWCSAAHEVGFLDRADNGHYGIHDFYDHAPPYVQQRAKRERERTVSKKCEQCGGEYRSAQNNSRFCTDTCRVKHSRRPSPPPYVTAVTDSLRTVTHSVTDCYGTPAPAPAPALKENTVTVIEPTKKRTKHADGLPGFDAFWAAYPRKVAKPAAHRAWASIAPDELLARRITRAVTDHIAAWRDRGTELEYIPHPATWLNARRWEDELTTTTATMGAPTHDSMGRKIIG